MNRALLATSFVTAALAAPALHAEPNARDRAAAEAIFRQATALMDQERYTEACEKFAASQELDPGLGTLLYLGDCYDRAGRSASAWALFREVEERSRRAAQPDREHIARERAEALEGKLSKVELRVAPARRVPGLEVRLAGSLIPEASWNTALPVDPGPTQVEMSAPGKRPAHLKLTVAPGPSQQVLTLPPLADAPRAEPRPEPTTAHRSATPAQTSFQKPLGYVLAGAGLAALGVGGYFGYRAHNQNAESKAQCRASDPNACTQDGFEQRESAQRSATVATIVAAGGATLAVGGLTLVLTAPVAGRDTASLQASWRGVW